MKKNRVFIIICTIYFALLFVSCGPTPDMDNFDCYSNKEVYSAGEDIEITFCGYCQRTTNVCEVNVDSFLYKLSGSSQTKEYYNYSIKSVSDKSCYYYNTTSYSHNLSFKLMEDYYINFHESMTINGLEPGKYNMDIKIDAGNSGRYYTVLFTVQ